MGNNYYDRRNRFTDKQLVDCYLKYDSQIKAAKELGCGRETVARAVRRAGIKMSGRLHNGSYERKCCSSSMKVTDKQLIESAKTMTSKEIAEKYSVHITTVQVRCKRLGIKPVGYENGSLSGLRKNWGKKNDNLKNKGCLLGNVWHYISTHDEAVKKNCPDFEYLESKGRRMRLKCRKCGSIIERDRKGIKRNIVTCEACVKKERQKKELQEAQAKMIRFLIVLKEVKTPKKCIACGKEFTSPYPNQLYCSDSCKNKRKRHRNSYRSRCKRYGVYFDRTVTREEVIKRDNCTCQICGKKCDPNDLRWGWSGPDFPTLDHIKPLAKGGTHTWGNVQCACGICNSSKRDLTDWEVSEGTG